VDEFRGIDL